jgi:hypothetical protein
VVSSPQAASTKDTEPASVKARDRGILMDPLYQGPDGAG